MFREAFLKNQVIYTQFWNNLNTRLIFKKTIRNKNRIKKKGSFKILTKYTDILRLKTELPSNKRDEGLFNNNNEKIIKLKYWAKYNMQ